MAGANTVLQADNANPPVYIPPPVTAFPNWNTLARMHDALLAAGYAEDEMYADGTHSLRGSKRRRCPGIRLS